MTGEKVEKMASVAYSIFIYSASVLLIRTPQAEGGFTLEQGIPHFNTRPYFLPPSTRDTNVTVLQGQSAYIKCRIAQLGDKKVSWIRGRDLHVLTSGLVTFASGGRFQSMHQERSENWTLLIRYAQIRDSGEYQCQVNSEPKISASFFLNVVEATTSITGSGNRYVKAGSTLKISCITSAAPINPGLLYWYRDSEILNEKNGVRITTSIEDVIASDLMIVRAEESDTGNYTCWPSEFPSQSVMVHVIPDEEPAAMSHGTVIGNGGSGRTQQDPLKNLSEKTIIPIKFLSWFSLVFTLNFTLFPSIKVALIKM